MNENRKRERERERERERKKERKIDREREKERHEECEINSAIGVKGIKGSCSLACLLSATRNR